MENIYSEKELVPIKGIPWGQWELSSSKEEINNKLATFPSSSSSTGKDNELWSNLFSMYHSKLEVQNEDSDVVINPSEEDIPMECSSIASTADQEMEKNTSDYSAVEDVSVYIVDMCNQIAPKLRSDLNSIKEEMGGAANELRKLKKEEVLLVMDSAWSQLISEASKLCFCMAFISNIETCQKLCKHVLYPWLNKSLPNKLELLSAILSTEGETVCCQLVAPLLRAEDSALVKDSLSLEELMSSMTEKHWTSLLREFLSGLGELERWHIPVLATIVENAVPSTDDMCLLTQLMTSTGTVFVQNREFGALLVAVTNSLKPGSGSFVSQLKLVANNYKGSLKFKALKILENVKD